MHGHLDLTDLTVCLLESVSLLGLLVGELAAGLLFLDVGDAIGGTVELVLACDLRADGSDNELLLGFSLSLVGSRIEDSDSDLGFVI